MLQTKTNDNRKQWWKHVIVAVIVWPSHSIKWAEKSNNKKEKERSPLTMCQISIQPNYWSAASGACICFTVYTCRHFSFVDSWPFNIIVKMIFFLHKHVVRQKDNPIFRFLALDVVAFSLRGFSFKNQTFKLPLGWIHLSYISNKQNCPITLEEEEKQSCDAFNMRLYLLPRCHGISG